MVGRGTFQSPHRDARAAKERGKADGGSGVASYRLRNRLRFRQLWKLFEDRRTEIVVGNDPEAIRRSERKQSPHGLLDHGLPAVEREQLLGTLLPAQGPETRAPATGRITG